MGVPAESYASEYKQYQLEQALPLVRFSCALGAITAIFFYWIDDLLLPEHSASVLKAWRLYYLLPVSLLWFAITLFEKTQAYIYWAIVTTGIPFGLIFVYVLYLSGPEATLYIGIALMQVCLFLVVLFEMPFRFYIAPLILFVTSFIIVLFINDTSSGDRLVAMISVLSVSTLGAAVALQREIRQRASFVQRQELQLLRDETERRREDRIRWFEGLSGFLRHELRNALTGVSTSIQMIKRHTQSESVARYAERAERSMEFMSRMLDRTTEASTLEAALIDEDYEPAELVDLVKMKAEEYRRIYTDQDFELHHDSSMPHFGNGDRFEQALDKLLTNAVEHSDGSEPITLRVHSDIDGLRVTISNIGDRLPENTEELFGVFVSTKTAGKSNLGIGLYVARTIIEKMGGKVSATALTGSRPGAQFEVSLPASPHSAHR